MCEAREVALVALYLRGLSPSAGVAPRAWPEVLSVLRRAGVGGQAPVDPSDLAEVLRDAGLWREAVGLANPQRWGFARDLVARGQAFSVESARYPARWRSRGGSAPPALWRKAGPASPPVDATSEIGCIVGSRDIARPVRSFAARAGEVVSEAGRLVLSGGAVGVDRAAVQAAMEAGGSAVELLACGFDHAIPSRAERWSLAAPGEPFSTPLAMERNLLLYAAAERSLVVHARFRAGGSWHGAVAALRSRVGPIFVREAVDEAEPDFSAAQHALVALGAQPIAHPDLFLSEAVRDPRQPSLALGA